MSEQEKGNTTAAPAAQHHTPEFQHKLTLACETVREGLGVKGLMMIAYFDDGNLQVSCGTRLALFRIIAGLPGMAETCAIEFLSGAKLVERDALLKTMQTPAAPTTEAAWGFSGYEI